MSAPRLNHAARTALRNAGIPVARWARANGYSDGSWHGDVCGCPDDRCTGYHHDEGEECGCLQALLSDYLSDFLTPEEIADFEWESGFSLDEQQLETELAEMQATTQRLNRLARKRSRGMKP